MEGRGMAVDPNEIKFYARQEQSKSRAYWTKLAFAIAIPILLGRFFMPVFYYALPVAVSMFCMVNRLPPSSGISLPKTQAPTEIPDMPGTRMLPQVPCPNCGQVSDAGNVYCPFCQQLMKKKY
jgi:hypothetical protein